MGKQLEYIINHVFLPPKLPHQDDSGVEETNALIKTVLATTNVFQNHLSEQERSGWISCMKMMRNMIELKDRSGHLMAEKLQLALREMSEGGMSWPFPVGQTSI